MVNLRIVVGLREMVNVLIVQARLVQVGIRIVILVGNVRVLTQVVAMAFVMTGPHKFVAEMNVTQLLVILKME